MQTFDMFDRSHMPIKKYEFLITQTALKAVSSESKWKLRNSDTLSIVISMNEAESESN